MENRRRQWALLGALAPDIALLQECRPPDLEDQAPGWMARGYRCVGLFQQLSGGYVDPGYLDPMAGPREIDRVSPIPRHTTDSLAATYSTTWRSPNSATTPRWSR